MPYIKNQKFDAIFLSNIFDYIHEWKFDYANIFSKDLMYYTPQQIEFFNICNDLMGLLNPSGKLQVHYVLGGNIQQNYQKISIENLFNFLAKHNEKFEISTIELSNGGPIIIENSEKEISGN